MSAIIGYIIESLRVKNNLTQSELAKKISLSRREIFEIEKNNVIPTGELLSKMVNVFKFDILTVIDSREIFSSDESYKLYVDIRLAIYQFDVRKLENLVGSVSTNIDFKRGETYQLFCHAVALIAIHVEKDYEKAIRACKDGITHLYDLDYEVLRNKRLTDYTYSLLISLTVCYSELGDIRQCEIIADNALYSIREYVFANDEPPTVNKHILQKCYVMLLNNSAHFSFELKDYDKSLELLNQGIPKCKEFELYDILAYFQHLKFESLYCLGKYDEAQENYNLFKTICIITSFGKLLINAKNEIKTKYPKINP